MAFDGIVTKCIVAELQNDIIGSKINKVFEPSKNEIVLGLYSNGKNLALNLCIDSHNYRVNLTTNTKPRPFNAPNFCMLLRKHIIGNRIIDISTYDLERIIIFTLEGYNELNDLVQKKLIVELMGKHSNIILINHNSRIIDSLRHLDSTQKSCRDILPARVYEFPSSNKISFIDLNDFEEFYNIIFPQLEKLPLNKVISNIFTGISNSFVLGCLGELNFNDTKDKNNIKLLFDYMKNIIEKIGTKYISCKLISTNHKINNDYSVVLHEADSNSIFNINFFIDDFYTNKENTEMFITYRNNVLKLILSELHKYTKRLNNINKKLSECNNMETYRLYGELLTANLYRLHNNVDSITVKNYYDNNSPITIPLDIRFSPAKNVQIFFKKYSKLNNALKIVEIQKKDTKRELNYIESLIFSIENCNTINDIDEIYSELSENYLFKEKIQKNSKKKNNTKISSISSPKEFIIDGYTVLVGKNNKQNDYLTLKIANKNDIWFHTQKIHGSHVILKCDNNLIPDEHILIKCAELAAYFSKAKASSNVPVDYTYVKYVKKPSGAKPGMVTYINYKTIFVTPPTNIE